ncbi:MAG TPA: hypothetical protein VGC67_04150 [Cellulomonas sp.]
MAVELIGGLMLMGAGPAMEAGGLVLDLSVAGLPAGVALNITGAGVISAWVNHWRGTADTDLRWTTRRISERAVRDPAAAGAQDPEHHQRRRRPRSGST